MIPRHQPAYTWANWFSARRNARLADELEADLGKKLCKRLGRRHAIFYQRGRDAFFAYFRVIAAGRPAIVPAFTCCVVPEAIRNAGNPLFFVDIDESTLNNEIDNLEKIDPPRDAVLVMTHQFGLPCRVGGIVGWARKRGLTIFEDCAGALGAEAEGRPCGSYGDVAIFSFENTKLIGSGTVGVLLTDDDDVAGRLRRDQEDFLPPEPSVIKKTALLKLINSDSIYRPVFNLWSWRNGDRFADHGDQIIREAGHYRHRAHPFALALVLEQWGDMERRIEHRRRLLQFYCEALGTETTCRVNEGTVPSPIRQPIRVANKRGFYEAMFRKGIDLGWSFAYAVPPREEAERFPNATRVAEQILNLPIHEGVSLDWARAIAQKAAVVLGVKR